MEKQVKALFSGTVQGVGFRFTARGIARRMPVKGYVKNLPDGQVELVAEGEEQEVKSLLERIRGSELSSYIRDVQTQWQSATGKYSTFEIEF